MLWEIDIHPAEGQPDRAAERVGAAARELGLAENLQVATARGFLVQGKSLDQTAIERLAGSLLVDTVVERANIGPLGDDRLAATRSGARSCVTVLLKPGVMDPVAQSALTAAADLDIHPEAIATLRKYWIDGASDEQSRSIGNKLLANDAIEQLFFGSLNLTQLEVGNPYKFELRTVSLSGLDDDALMRLSREGQLYLQLAEMQTIQRQFRELGRDPTDVELETIAQTWSEHCSHKTLAGRIAYRDENGERQFDNMLKETIFAATQKIRAQLGNDDWCVSVFEDNAGVVRFDDQLNLAFKVETHNHPSALEPYGGANTGVGGVIRDIMGTGLGAKPIASTDVFCFAPPDFEQKRGRVGERERGSESQSTLLPFSTSWRASSAPCHARRCRGCARLWQSHGDSHRQRGRVLRRALSGQSARVLRQCWIVAARQVAQAHRAGRSHCDGWRPHGARRNSRGHVF
jgi:phosphoribosylformylglycinamidine (FGAM) synthase PurS component